VRRVRSKAPTQHRNRTTDAVWARGLATYNRIDRLSFVGALLVATARGRGIEFCYPFDAGVGGLDGVTRLNTNVDPRTR